LHARERLALIARQRDRLLGEGGKPKMIVSDNGTS
jgi:hypothetical protein